MLMSGTRRVIGTVAVMALFAACSGGSSAPVAADPTEVVASTASWFAAPSASTSGTTGEETSSAPPVPEAPPESAPPAPPAEPPSTSVPADPVPVSDPPQTGVPGAFSDVVCRSVGTLLVSEYLIGLVEAFGDEPGARRAEAMAAPAIVAALDEVAGALASAGLGEDPFADRWAGMAGRARTALAAADLGGAGLAAAWLEVLSTHDRNNPALVLPLDADRSTLVDRAAAAVAAEHGPLGSDEGYLTSVVVATPAVDDHLAQRCPEVAALTAGDAV